MKAPIYLALNQYAKQDFLRLHMPGHVGEGNQLGLKDITGIDLTEIPGLDDLHQPTGVIKQSQCLLADAFGAKKSFFLVNGATSGIHALFLALAAEGSKIIIPRNAHRSFYEGMVLSGAVPVYVPVQSEPQLGIALAVTAENIEQTIKKNLDAQSVFIGSPSYYGTTSDISAISRIVRNHHNNLMVDEAHGAHFRFSKLFPKSALEEGADAVVHGLHKTLPVLNQGAALHLAPSLAQDIRIDKAVSLLTTTSPSYPILASIELACRFMEQDGQELLNMAYELSVNYRCKINTIKGLKAWGHELGEMDGVKDLDPLKVIVSVYGTGLNGYQFDSILREKYHIQVELADNNFILAMFSIMHKAHHWEMFYQALKAIAEAHTGSNKTTNKILYSPPLPKIVLSPRQAFGAKCRRVVLADACDQVAGEMIAAYPPGIPCVLPGELITREMVDYLLYLTSSGARLQGPEDSSLEYVNIIEAANTFQII